MAAPGAGNGSTNQTILIDDYDNTFINLIVDFFWTNKYNSYKRLELKFENDNIQLKRLIIMIGAADFLYGKNANAKGAINTHSNELVNLVTYLKSIKAHKPDNPNEMTIVLAFDEAYNNQSIDDDFNNLNKLIFQQRTGNSSAFELSQLYNDNSFKEDYDANIEEYALPTFRLNEPIKEIYDYYYKEDYPKRINEGFSTCRIGNIYFQHHFFNFQTKYKKKSPNDLYKLRDKAITSLGDECKPKPHSDFEKLQNFCERTPFEEYYLYNCVWVGGSDMFHLNNNSMMISSNPVHNRYLELGCEFLYIFTHLTKPSFLLTFGNLHTFNHTNEKKVGNLFITPVNSTTTFKNNSWKVKVKQARGGKRRTTTRKQKKRSRKNRK